MSGKKTGSKFSCIKKNVYLCSRYLTIYLIKIVWKDDLTQRCLYWYIFEGCKS